MAAAVKIGNCRMTAEYVDVDVSDLFALGFTLSECSELVKRDAEERARLSGTAIINFAMGVVPALKVVRLYRLGRKKTAP